MLFLLFTPIFLFAQVDTVWARKWSSSGALSDWAYAIAIDDSGYVYVTGTTENSGTNNDCTTIKYAPEGDTVWVRNYASAGSYNERASCIALGASGSIYLTGYTMSSSAGDYLTIKYRPNGDTAWVRRYNGTGNGYDFAHWICVDNQENVYVTGYSRGTSYQDDIATVKYDSNGNQIWVSRINGSGNYNDKGHKVVADNNGYVYVVGYVNPFATGTLYDYVTIKLNAQNGDTVWIRTYNGPADSSDIARDIAVDNEGNVYVTGSVRWTGTSTDIYTIKYDSSGNVLWERRYNNPDTSGADGGYGIKVDSNGNVYVVGQSQGLGTGSDIVLIKYDPNGNELWVQRYNGPASGYDTPSDEVGGKCIDIDQSGNVYIGGTSRSLNEYNDYVAMMYDPQGNQRWVAMYDFSDSLDYCLAIAAHPNSGDVVITGRTLCTPSYYDWGTVKFKSLVAIRENDGYYKTSVVLEIKPNPFENHCVIKFQIPSCVEPQYVAGFIHQTIPKSQSQNNLQSEISLRIYNICGQLVKQFNDLIDCQSIIWWGEDDSGRKLPGGVYFLSLESNIPIATRKVVLLR